MKLDGISMLQTSETAHKQGGVHIYGVVPHPMMVEVDLINSYLNYFINKDYDYIGFLGPGIYFENPRVIQNLAIGLDKWNLNMISPESAEDIKKHGMGLRDTFMYDMLLPECWLTTPDTVRAILNEYGFFLDARYETPEFRLKDLYTRMKHLGLVFGLHRGVEHYGPKYQSDTFEDYKRYQDQYAIRASGEEEDSITLEHEDHDEQEQCRLPF